MQIIPYLYFNGCAEEAMALYQRAFKTPDPEIMRFRDQPAPDMPEAFGNRIMHAELITSAGSFYVSDTMGTETVTVGDNVQVNINCESAEEQQFIYSVLSEGGKITMPLQDTFWGAIYGAFTDRYGISWSLNFQKSEPHF